MKKYKKSEARTRQKIMETSFGGKKFEYRDRNGEIQEVRINDAELFKGLQQIQNFEHYQSGEQFDRVAVVYSKKDWIETLNRLGCEPTEYWNSNKFSEEDLYAKVRNEDVTALLSVLNGSKSEKSKDEKLQQACSHFGKTYLGKTREELVEKNKGTGFEGILEWLENTRRNQSY